MPFPLLHSLYLAASHVTGPAFRLAQRRALARGKEDPARVGERWGRTDRARPSGPLVWFHAASVGETQSILPLITELRAARPDVAVLVTSTTRTSAEMLARDLPAGALHQVAPYDTVRATRAFLDHWRPDLAIWVESELWPRMLREVSRQGVPMLLVNARVSARTMRRWQRVAATTRALLAPFGEIHVQEQATFEAISGIGIPARVLRMTGSLKQDRPPLSHDPTELARFRDAVAGRDIWCAASTHPGEDEIVLDAHAVRQGLLVLVPRHAERAADIAKLCAERGLKVARRSRCEAIGPDTRVYIADTMGEMGLWYRLCPVSLVAGSLVPVGGHNPYEPAELGSAVLHGPHVGNFAEIYERLDAAGAAVKVEDTAGLSAQLDGLTPAIQGAMVQAARAVLGQGQGATKAALGAILSRLPD